MRRLLMLSSFAILAIVSNPAKAQFCPGVSPWVFDDVLASDPFCSYITWMAQNGVTLGCALIDANHRLYCPNTAVPRSQMAAFMNRLSTQPDTTAPSVGTIAKPGGVFLHNFGTANTFLGVAAGNFTMSGTNNTGIGPLALAANTTGSSNVAVGALALPFNTTGFNNTAIGQNALAQNTTGSSNTAGGTGALGDNTTGLYNTGFGDNALGNNATGGNNSALGFAALLSNTTGGFNTAIGNEALIASTTASNNTAVGSNALRSNTIGQSNVALGKSALRANLVGSQNVGVGVSALEFNTGSGNVAVGHQSLLNVGGAGNTAVGQNALANLASGGGNIAIGNSAGAGLFSGINNIYIAHQGPVGNEDSTVRIGTGQTRTFISGVRGATTGSNDAVNVVIDGNGQLGTISSSRDSKDDIADMSNASSALMQLRPVTFHYKSDQDRAGPRLQYGLIAEEVAAVYPGMVAIRDGKPETVMYQYLAPMLLNELQKQQQTIDAQGRALTAEREARAGQAREVAELRSAVEALLAAMANRTGVSAR